MKIIKNKKENFSTIKLNMLKSLFIILAICWVNIANAQLAINEDDSSGDVNSELDISSTTKGVIFPVMTEAERDAIPSPADGLLIFNRSGGYHNYYNGTNWMQISRGVGIPATNPNLGTGTDVGLGVGVSDPDNSAILHVNSTTKGFLLPRPTEAPASVLGMIYYSSFSDLILFFNGTDWQKIIAVSGNVGAGGAGIASGFLVGSGTIDASAKMEVRTTGNKGMLIPRLTDVQRDAIDSPLEGLTIFNVSTNEIQYYIGATWYPWSYVISDYGQVITNPGLSCKDIYDNNPASVGVDGVYYIDPDGAGGNSAYDCNCDMTTDGGGWTLVENTGPKRTNNRIAASVGSMPVPTAVGSAFTKLSDVDINLIREDYTTSIMRVERPNGAFSANVIYFKQNRVFNSAAGNNSTSIRHYYTSYADAISNTNMGSGTSNYGSAFDTWAGGSAGYQMIFSYGAEGFISNGANNTCGGTDANSRSECNTLLWIKNP